MIYIKGFSNDILELEENLNFFKKNGIDIKLNNDEKTNNVTIILTRCIMIYIKGFSNDILELEENLNFFKKNGIDIKLNNDEKTNNVTIILKPDVIKRKIKRGGRYTKNTIQKYKIDEVYK